MRRYGHLDYGRLTKIGFTLGISMFLTGALGEFLLHELVAEIDPIIDSAFFSLEVGGLLLGLLSPFVFGVFLPLTE